MAGWIQDSETGEMVPREKWIEHKYGGERAPAVHGDIEAFRSPIDGSIIDDRGKLRAHNKKHGVTNCADYSQDWFDKKASERESVMRGDSIKAKRERQETIKDAIQRHGG
jgi:hypothetical protein